LEREQWVKQKHGSSRRKMVDPLTITGAIAGIKVANEAFGAIKSMLENGRTVADCGTALGKWMAGVSAVEKEAANRGSVTGDNASSRAIEIVSARNQVRRQRNELREWMQLYGPPGSWDEFIQLERQFRLEAKEQKQNIQKQKAKRLNTIKNILVATLITFGIALMIGIGLVVYLNVSVNASG